MTAHLIDPFASAQRHLSRSLAFVQRLNGAGALEVEAFGAEVTLSDGRVLVDFGSYAVTLFGHRHPMVISSVMDALGTMPTSTRVFANGRTIAFAERLVESVGCPSLSRVWFGTNGSDVVEAALKLARISTGRTYIAAVTGAYHGKSLGALGATYSAFYRPMPLPEILPPTIFLDPLDPSALRHAAKTVDFAAVIVEPVQGESGVHPLSVEVLDSWRRDAASLGTFFIADEVQSGLGRCGPMSIAVAEKLNPDAVLFGKALGGGVLPLSAAVMTEELFAPLQRDPFIHSLTFGGHPMCVAAGDGALNAWNHERPQFNDIQSALTDTLRAVRELHPALVTATRQRGLMAAIELSSVDSAGETLVALAHHGLIVSPCLGSPATLRLLPSLVTTDEQARRARQAVLAALADAKEIRSLNRESETSCPS